MLINLQDTCLPRLKAALRRALPTVGSCHLSEAIAAGFGFHTYGGLQAALTPRASKAVFLRTLSEPAFGARLHALTGVIAPSEALLAAVVRSMAGHLRVAQSRAEGALNATIGALHYSRWSLQGADDLRFSERSLALSEGARSATISALDYSRWSLQILDDMLFPERSSARSSALSYLRG
jgi:hypothetical protein